MDAVSGGKLPPEVMEILDAHIKETMDMIQMYMENIDEIAMAKQAAESAQSPEPPAGSPPALPGGMSSPSVNANVVPGANNGSGSEVSMEE